MRCWRARHLVAGLAAVTCLGAVAPTAAVAADTAEGRCTLTGRLKFDPPIGNEQRETAYRDRARGTCTGTLNGAPIEDSPVTLRARGSGRLSCLANRGISRGVLTFTRGTRTERDDVRITYIAESTGALTQFVTRVRGRRGGESVGQVDFLTRGDESAFELCARNELRSGAYTTTGQTTSPLEG